MHFYYSPQVLKTSVLKTSVLKTSVLKTSVLRASFLIGATSLLQSPIQADSTPVEDVLTITVTGEAKPMQELTSSVHSIEQAEINRVNPAHPAQILNRVAGVHVNNLGGEGHMTAIRQPISTNAVYLFLEDGIPTRPSGLFNHNGLYEINMPQAQTIEVIKGPGSALYGSESIGGIINTLTQPSPEEFEFTLNPEIGSDQMHRVLLSVGHQLAPNFGARWNVNITNSQGYRDEADYSRIAQTLRLDASLGDIQSKTIAAFSTIAQSGVDSLEQDQYQEQSRMNRFHNDVGRRDVDALRLSNEFAFHVNDKSKLILTPYYRQNQMKLMPSWMLTYDPNDRDYQFKSYGLLARFRYKTNKNIEWIMGLDTDYTPSEYTEIRLEPQIEDGIYVNTRPTGRVNYDFTADQLAISPYLHTEWQALSQLRFTAGIRYDYFNIDYTDRLESTVVQTQTGADRFTHRRPASQTRAFESLSPKLGLVWQASAAHSVYASYRHSFRAPSIGSLFRSGSTTNTDQLNPIKTLSLELGARGQLRGASYDVALYQMQIRDDIVRLIDVASNDRQVSNAGETQHYGLEITFAKRFAPEWSGHLAMSYSEQTYEDFSAVIGFPAQSVNYAGNDVPKAPATLASLSVRYEPLRLLGSHFELELSQLGEYFTDEANSQTYAGHVTAQLLATVPINRHFEVYGRVMNLTDRVYSTLTSNQVGDPDLAYRPGHPRSFFLGFRYQL